MLLKERPQPTGNLLKLSDKILNIILVPCVMTQVGRLTISYKIIVCIRLTFSPPKTNNFQKKNNYFMVYVFFLFFFFFSYFRPKTDTVSTRYNRLGETVLTSTHNPCFLSETRKKVYTYKPQFNYVKVGFKGIKIVWAYFRDEKDRST